VWEQLDHLDREVAPPLMAAKFPVLQISMPGQEVVAAEQLPAIMGEQVGGPRDIAVRTQLVAV
jgi:hypothetical protein